MKTINLNRGWTFTEGEISNFPMLKKEGTIVNLPHDMMIHGEVTPHSRGGSQVGFYPECVGTYEKVLEFTENEITDTMLLSFGGCYGKTRILVNGNPAGRYILIMYPWRLAATGDFDLCGFVKPQSVYHRIIWGSKETYIFSRNPANTGKIELIGRYGWPEGGHHWIWPVASGGLVTVEVYSRGDEVELLLNGKSLGRQPAGSGNHYKAVFELEYVPGDLCAISYVNNIEISRDQVVTAGKPEQIRITMERSELIADGQSLAYGMVEIIDADGNYIPTALDVLATAEVLGNATLAAFGNGRGATEENYTAGRFTSYEGRWQLIVRAGYEHGEVSVSIHTETFGSAITTVFLKSGFLDNL